MSQSVIPDRYHRSVIPHIMVEGAARAIEFYEKAFGAKELFRIAAPDGKIIHAELVVADSLFMLGDAEPPFRQPHQVGGTTFGLHVYVNDVDRLFSDAVQHDGITVIQALQDMFYGARTCMLQDPFGHIWVFLQHMADMTPAAIEAAGRKLLGS